ncbi:MAG: glutamyl-tRNA reductase, partial [Pseudomonadota bacterium]
MRLISLGINHTSAGVDVRERVAFAPEQVGDAMHEACRQTSLDEIVVLSTCNRTEIYAVSSAVTADGATIESDFAAGQNAQADELLTWLANYHHLSADELQKSAYRFQGEEAFRHLVQVAAGLDSMVLGEPQIFGQLKSAYAVANDAGTIGAEL